MNPCIYVLNEAQWAHFWEAMTTPREPTEAMKLAAKRHKELVIQAAEQRGRPWTDADIQRLVQDVANAND